MQNVKINFRVKNILLKICTEQDYVTIATIAKDLEVSTKTVLRELPEVERWLELGGFSLDKKTGFGIKIKGDSHEKQEIRRLLDEEKEEKIYLPKERQSVIISELLQNQEPVKLYSFTSMLKVTDGTISNDLDKAEQWFVKHGVTLIRKPGLGVYIEGSEKNIRKAMIDFIYENTDESQLLGLIRNNLTKSSQVSKDIELKTRSRLLNLIDKEIINKLETSIHEVEENVGYKLADTAYVGLIVHLALAIQRIRKNEKIIMDKEFLTELKTCHEYSIATDMATGIAKAFDIEIPEDEIGYITMHIKGSKNQNSQLRASNKPIGNFELVKLAKEMIKIAENETGSFLIHNEKLLIGLVNHLGPAISRLKMNLDIRNPLLEEIKTFYPALIEVSRKCVRVLENHMGIKMPESELAYIAMHLGAVIENSEKLPKQTYRVAIACPTGIGTSRLLATRIEKEYDNIEIVDIISTIHIEENWLREKEITFIISTVTIEDCFIPVVTVNPLLFEEDKNKINRQIKLLKNNVSLYTKKVGDALKFKDKLILLTSYNKAILQILDHFFLIEDEESQSMENLIIQVSKKIANSESKKEKLVLALKEREEKGGTFITGHQFLLLHCRTEVVEELYFGAVKVKNKITVENGKGEIEEIKLGIIMLAPENCDKCYIETISYVSQMLIERPNFTKFLKDGIEERAFEEVSNILEEFYKGRHNKLMEAGK